MPWVKVTPETDDDRRVKAVAEAAIAAEFDGAVTLDAIEKRYGEGERRAMQRRYEQRAREFLAMFDAAMKFKDGAENDHSSSTDG